MNPTPERSALLHVAAAARVIESFGAQMSEFFRPAREADIEVEIQLLPVEEGGRHSAVSQGWRVPQDFGLPGELNDGLL